MKNIFKWILPCFCLATIVACSDDPEAERQGKPVTELTPDENKQELDQIGQKVLAKINPRDHETLIKVTNYFFTISEYLEEIERNETKSAIAVAKTINRICAKSDLGHITSLSGKSSNLYKASQFYGIYTYDQNSEEWNRTDSGTSMEFHFKYSGKDAILKITSAGKEFNLEAGDGSMVAIPENVSASLSLGGNELCKVMVNSQLNDAQRTAHVVTNLSASGYNFEMTTDAAKTKVSYDFSMRKNDESIIRATTTADGQNMTDPGDYGIDHPETLFQKASTKIYILNEANIYAECSNIKNLVNELDGIDYSGDYSNSGNRYNYNNERSCKKEATIYSKYMKAELRYEGSDAIIATIGFQSYLDYAYEYSDSKYEYWEIEPILIFANDESRFSFEDYFDNVTFSSLIRSAEDLYDEYEFYID